MAGLTRRSRHSAMRRPYLWPWAALLPALCTFYLLIPPAPTGAQGQTPAQVGQWSPTISLPMVGVHLVVMPTGKVFMMSAESQVAGAGALVWDPAAPTTFLHRPSPFANMFCSGHTLLADGRILITGGDVGAGEGILDSDIFNPFTETWTDAAEMTLARWYPTATTLGDGRVLVMGGTNAARQIVNIHEVYDPSVDMWSRLPTSANMPYRYYPLNYLLPDGRILVAGSYSDNEPTRVLNLATNLWATVDSTLRQAGSSVMFLPGKILNSGSRAYQATTASVTAARVLDMTQTTPSWQNTGSMSFPRAYHTLTMLPDGQVLVTGGTATGAKSDLAANIHQAEMWSPTTGQWTTMATAAVPQGYHSAAVLLFDGRVLVTGQGRSNGPNDADPNDQRFAELYSPPYLFKGARPVITSAPSIVNYGATFSISTPDASDISAVSLISLPAVTHGFNENQHFLPLTRSVIAGGLSLQAPSDANLAPPGYYMLFIVNTAGVPSVASLVRIPAVGEDAEAPSDPGPLNASGLSGSLSLNWGASTDNVAVTAYNVHRSAAAGFTPGPSNKIGQTAATSFLDANLPTGGTYYYRVTAQDAKGNVSLPSNQAFAAPLPVTVPNLVDQAQAAASATLDDLGLNVGAVTTASSVTIAVGRVISHNPAAGEIVQAGSAVTLLVSTGLPPVLVPNVVGLTQSAASSALLASGLLTGAISSASSPTVPVGFVISQNPLADASAQPGSPVALTISTGPATNIQVANVQSAFASTSSAFIDLPYTVPNLPGQDLLLVVQAGAEASTTNFALPLGATFNGRTLTRAGAIRTPASNTNNGSGIFWMTVQSNETGTIRVTFTGTCIERGVGASTLVGASLAGPTVVEMATGTATLTDLITTTSPNALVISTATQGNAGALTATGTGHVRDFNVAPASSQVAGGHAEVATPATLTLGYSAGNINRIAMVLAAFANAAGSAPSLSSVTLNPATVTGGTPSNGTATLTGLAPQGGAVVTLSSNNTSAATVSPSVTVPAGAISANFTVTTSTVISSMSATITGTFGGSRSAILAVNPPPVAPQITAHPSDRTVTVGQTAAFSVVSTGTPTPTYQWSKNGVSIAGATAATYTTPATVAGDDGAIFNVAVTNSEGSITSNNAILTVTVPVLAISTLNVNPTSVTGGANSTATLTLNATAPAGGAVVPLSSNNAAATVPAAVTVAAAASTATFTVTTAAVATAITPTLTATLNGIATATLTVNPPPSFVPIRINAGGPAYTDTLGRAWNADAGFSAGGQYVTTSAISNTSDPTLYRSERYGNFSYSFAAPAGGYAVTLKFAEIWFTGVGQRVFNVAINGASVLSNFDIRAQAGASFVALDRTFQVTSTGTITIQFTAGSADLPKVSAIEIAASAAAPPVPPSIISQPANQTVNAGQTATFAVVASGTPAPTYQWRKGGVTISGATAASYTTPATVAGDNNALFSVVVTNSANSVTSNNATLTVNAPVLAVSSLGVNPGSVIGGVASTGTVTLNAAAPAGGAVVSLSSNHVAAAVPLNVSVSSGATTATFAVNTSVVAAQASAIITATLNGSAAATLTIQPSATTVASVTLNPAAVTGGTANSSATVTLNGPAPPGGAVVALASGNTVAATVPASATVAAGASSATFTVTSKAVASQTNVVVSAIWNGAATVTLTVNPPSSFTPIRVNAGGPAYTDTLGRVWSADTGFSGGSQYTTANAISNTSDPTLYRSERWGNVTYSFAAPAGSYAVTLKFAEIWFTGVGQRAFNLAINGTSVLSNFDIRAQAGASFVALDRTFQVTSTGTITIQLTAGSADDPKISAIEITR